MDNSRMSTADMLQYCDEALAWEEFGPVDIFFFESEKRSCLGSAVQLKSRKKLLMTFWELKDLLLMMSLHPITINMRMNIIMRRAARNLRF